MAIPLPPSIPASLIDLDETFLPIAQMRQIARVTRLSGPTIMGEVELGPSHWVYAQHFPGDPVFPGTLMIEAAGQLVALWAWAQGCRGRPRLVRTTAQFHTPVNRSVSRLVLRGEVVRRRNLLFGTVEVVAAEVTVATVEGCSRSWHWREVGSRSRLALSEGRCWTQSPEAQMVGPIDYTPAHVDARADARVADFLRRVYAWMCVGLLVTAAVAYFTASTPPLVQALASNRMLFWGIAIAELALVFYTSSRIGVLSPAAAGGLFLLYSALNGLTMSFILLAFTGARVASAFVIAAGMFAAMAVFGLVTTRSLGGLAQFAFMGLIGLIIASIVNLFLKSAALDFVLSVVGVIVFAGLTAWDMQRLKQMALATEGGPAGAFAVGGALSLYLDFINLFLSLLRFGNRR